MATGYGVVHSPVGGPRRDRVLSRHRSLATAGRAWVAHCEGKPGTFGHPTLRVVHFAVEGWPDVTAEALAEAERETKAKLARDA